MVWICAQPNHKSSCGPETIHSLVSFSLFLMGPSPDVSSIGQIAQLTGGESGNKSPLGVEMYGSAICLEFVRDWLELTKNIVKL